jgi:hypothetical protein
MTEHKIVAENLGPISSLEFSLEAPGVTVLVAPNGSGKTILLDSIQAAARGEGKLPLRDRTRKGKLEAFGACITIGGTCRHTGAFEVTNLEGRFDLDGLVDPRLKNPIAADRARIKALVSLTGVEASVNLFRSHEAFADFDSVVTAESLATDDLIEMATKVKADYDNAALSRERLAERENGQALALVPPSDLDLDEESDPVILQAAYDEARDEVTRLAEQAKLAAKGREAAEKSKALLNELGADELQKQRADLMADMKACNEAMATNSVSILELQMKIKELQAENSNNLRVIEDGSIQIITIDRQLSLVEEAKRVIATAVVDMPDEDIIAETNAELERATRAVELGVKIRSANADAAKSQQHRTAAKLAREKADKYRDAGKATDEVLSSCIKCPQLRVESDGKSARLVTDTDRGKSINYHELSDGEKWSLAIDIGADQVGEGGLLTVSQIGWEGIDADHRSLIHKKGVERGVYILTLEASRVKGAPKTIVPTPYDDSMVPIVEPETTGLQTELFPVERETIEVPAKQPKPAPKAAAKKASPPPAEAFSDDEDIPF